MTTPNSMEGVLKALEHRFMSTAEAEGRNIALNKLAFGYGQAVPALHTEADAYELVQQFADSHEAPMDNSEVQATIRSGITGGMADPWSAPKASAEGDLDSEILAEVRRQTVQAEAKRLVLREEAAGQWTPPMDVLTLSEAVEASKEGIQWCINGVSRLQSRIGLIAQNKSGKSTLALSLAHSYLSGEDFLGHFKVDNPISGTVVYLNYDMELPDITEWAQKRGLDTKRFMIMNLRSTQNPFASAPGQEWLKAQLKAVNAKAVIIDSFADAFVGIEQNNNSEVSNWLLEMYALLTECEVEQQVMIFHSGHQGAHARGASSIEDKLDTKVMLTRDTDGVRHLEMKGRNVNFAKDELVYHEDSHSYTLADKPAQIAEVQDKIVFEYVSEYPGSNRGTIADHWKSKGQNVAKLNDCLARLTEQGKLIRSVGTRGAHHYHTSEFEQEAA